MSDMKNCDTHAEWLALRRNGIGAFESAGIIGVSPYSSPYSVWASKVGQVEVAETIRMKAGKVFEDGVAKLFVDETGLEVTDPGPYATWWRGRAFATPDRLIGHIPVELKFIGGPVWEEPPIYYQIQLQHQMMCLEADYGYLAAWFANAYKFAHWRIERNGKFTLGLERKIEQFWQLVESNTPPDIDGSPATEEALKALHPNDTGEIVQLPAEAEAWTSRLEEIGEAEKALADERRLLQNQLRAAIGSASFGEVGGITWSLKTSTRKAYTVEEKTFRTLRRGK